jgi:hypothetical protein
MSTPVAGAQILNMGLNDLNASDVVFKRKYRWLFTIYTDCGSGIISSNWVKLASRPNLTIEETEINFLNGKMWIPGKASWETITVTYYDLAGSTPVGSMDALYSWLATVYNFTTKAVPYSQSSKRGAASPGGPGSSGGYAGVGILALYDGCGNPLEEWVLQNMWPQAVNFGELDYSASEEVTIELTLRYSEVQFTGVVGCSGNPYPCCTGCAS